MCTPAGRMATPGSKDSTLISQFPAGSALLSLLSTHVGDKHRDAIISKTAELVSQARGSSNSPNGTAPPDLSSALATVPGTSFVAPRGKFDLVITPEAITLANPKANSFIQIPVSAINSVTILDSIPKDTKGKILMFISISKAAGIMNGKQKLEAAVIQTSVDAELNLPAVQGSDEPLSGPAAVVLCGLLGKVGITAFLSPDPEVYQSAKGHLAMRAIWKVNEGYLFPLGSAFCFVERPAMFIPHDLIKYVTFSRTGASSSTFDLSLHMADSTTLEFSQIDRSELGCLQQYVSRSGLKGSAEEAAAAESKAGVASKASGAAGGSKGKEEGDAGDGDDEDDDDEEDDSDFDPEGSEEGEEAGAKHGSRGGGKRGRDADEEGGQPSKRRDVVADEEDLGSEEDDEEEDEDSDDEDEESDDDSFIESDDEVSKAALAKHMKGERQGQGSKKRMAQDSDDGEDE